MKLFYNPAFTGSAYVDFKTSPVFFDSKIVNTAGLCNVIRLHAGICCDVADYGTRFVHYYAAMKKYMAKNPKSVMAASFKVDQLNTAKKCLEWRDTLAAGGWSKDAPAPTKRMEALRGIEEFFGDKSDGEALLELIAQVEDGCPLPEMEIIVPEYYEDFAPAEVRLLKALIERGVNFTAVKANLPDNNIGKVYSILEGKSGVELDPTDDSFEIWNFAERDDAIKYLSLLDADNFDVWINAENKEFDNWQKLEGKWLSGSEISGIPHTAQLLNIALTIFERPLNVINIVEWLNTSPNPLNAKFKKKLAEKICKSGGYYNDSCKKFIEDSITNYPDSKDTIEKFLPDINHPYFEESEIKVSEIKEFVKNIRDWCYKEISNNKKADPVIDQLGFVANQAENILSLLDELGSEKIPYEEIAQITAAFTADHSITQYTAQVGSKKIITSYADFCDAAEKTIWCDFYNSGDSGKLTYSFLVPAEIKAFEGVLPLWQTKQERDYLRNILKTPFVKTRKKLVLVILEKIGSEDAPKSPVYIQLEKYFADKSDPNNFSKNRLLPYVKQMKLDDSLYKEIKPINNRMESEQEFIQITKADYIKDNWPDHQSPSDLEKLLPYPLDYVIDTFVGFSGINLDSLPGINNTAGNVAHKIVQILFEPKESEKHSGTPAYIRKQIDEHFEEVFEKTVQSQGGIYLIKENKLELQKFKTQLKDNLEQLLKGIEANNLHVVSCEEKLGYKKEDEKVIQHGYIDKDHNLDITGKADMILENSDHEKYIFDFKWSTHNRFANYLKNNTSIQLALYKELLKQQSSKDVKVVAYYLFPSATFISISDLKGSINLTRILPEVDRAKMDLLEEIENTYKYRVEEIFSGKLEESSYLEPKDITYEKMTKDLKLLPIEYKEDYQTHQQTKKGPFEDIGLIKGRK